MTMKIKKPTTTTTTTPTPTVYAPPKGIEVLVCKDQLIAVGNDEYIAVVGAHPDLARDAEVNADGTPTNPAQPNDVLSVQPNGDLQTRPAGTQGNYERLKIGAAGLVARPIGREGRCWLIAYTDTWPNG